jgi:hypothetical protein
MMRDISEASGQAFQSFPIVGRTQRASSMIL